MCLLLFFIYILLLIAFILFFFSLKYCKTSRRRNAQDQQKEKNYSSGESPTYTSAVCGGSGSSCFDTIVEAVFVFVYSFVVVVFGHAFLLCFLFFLFRSFFWLLLPSFLWIVALVKVIGLLVSKVKRKEEREERSAAEKDQEKNM